MNGEAGPKAGPDTLQPDHTPQEYREQPTLSRRERYEYAQRQMLLDWRDRIDTEMFRLAIRQQELERELVQVEEWLRELWP